MAATERTVNVRVLRGGPVHIEVADLGEKGVPKMETRRVIVLPGADDKTSVRGVNVPAADWKLAEVKPMVKGMLDRGDLIASA